MTFLLALLLLQSQAPALPDTLPASTRDSVGTETDTVAPRPLGEANQPLARPSGSGQAARGDDSDSPLAVGLAVLAIAISAVSAWYSHRQYKLQESKEISSVSAHTFVEVIHPPRASDDLQVFLRDRTNFYLRITNTGSTAINDIWIRFPDNMRFRIPTLEQKTFDLKVFHIKEAILPDERLVVLFDPNALFGINFTLVQNVPCALTMKYKNPREKGYNVLSVPVEVRRQESGVQSGYTVGFDNAINLGDGDVDPISPDAFDKL